MQKLYTIVKVMLIFALLFAQSDLYAQKYCVDCKADVKVVSDKQVLLEKIDLKSGTPTTSVNTNLYVSYRSGNSQKFWTNLVIATAGVAVSTQLNKANLAEGKSANGISPLLPLGVSVATLPSIWKNRPRNVPQAGLWIQHRDTRGKLLETWEQPISSEAKNDAELLTVSINKHLTAGTLEVYLQNGSKNGVYYWGYETTSKSKKSDNTILQNPPVSFSIEGCPDGYLPNGNGMCCNPFTGDCVSEGGGTPPPPPPPVTPPTTPPTPIGGGCPAGYLSNGQGMCCEPFSGNCISEGGGNSGGGTPTVENNTPPSSTPPSTIPINLQNVAQGCPAGYLSNGQGMCCNPFTGSCVSEKAIHDPTNSNFVSSFIVGGPPKPPCAIWVCNSYSLGYGNAWAFSCGWLEYQCPTPPSGVPPFPNPTPGPPVNCGPGFHFDGTFCISDNQYDGRSPFYPINGGTTGTGTGGTDGGNGGNNGGGSPPPSKIDKSEVTTPCFLASVNTVASPNSANDFIKLLHQAFGATNSPFNLKFTEQPVVLGRDASGNTFPVAAQTSEIDVTTNTVTGEVTKTITISLSQSMLPGTSEIYRKFAIIHETMHAYLESKNDFPDHSQMLLANNMTLLYGAIRNVTGLSPRETYALCMYGNIQAKNSPNWESALTRFNNDLDIGEPLLQLNEILSIGDSYSNTTRNPNDNTKTLSSGGSQCR